MGKKIISLLLLIAVVLTICITNQPFLVLALTPDFEAKAAYLIDVNSSEVLYEQNALEKLPVASIVKLMTIYLTCKEIKSGDLNLTDKITATSTAASMGGSQVFIEEGGIYTVEDLLKSTIISSANDASVLLAETISGTEENFVSLMNTTAVDLGLNNTHYVNCTGLPAVGQFSCAKDTVMLLKEVIKFNTYHKYSTIWMDTLSHPNNRQSELVNTNKLIRYYEGCDGGKTGSTSEAGYCLVATAKRGNMRLIGCVLGTKNSKERFAETSKLFNYGFNNFENKEVVNISYLNNEKISIQGGREKEIEIMPQQNLYLLLNKNQKEKNYEIKIKISNVIAPVSAGQKVGEIIVVKNGQVVAKTNIISKTNVEKANYLDKLLYSLNNWSVA